MNTQPVSQIPFDPSQIDLSSITFEALAENPDFKRDVQRRVMRLLLRVKNGEEPKGHPLEEIEEFVRRPKALDALWSIFDKIIDGKVHLPDKKAAAFCGCNYTSVYNAVNLGKAIPLTESEAETLLPLVITAILVGRQQVPAT